MNTNHALSGVESGTCECRPGETEDQCGRYGDEDLPYEDASFDVAISLVGAMFASHPHKLAAEFARVVRPGGKLYMANWTAHRMPARMFECLAGYVPPSLDFMPPVPWGDEETIMQWLGCCSPKGISLARASFAERGSY